MTVSNSQCRQDQNSQSLSAHMGDSFGKLVSSYTQMMLNTWLLNKAMNVIISEFYGLMDCVSSRVS